MIQSGMVRDRLAAAYPTDSFELVVIRTKGDQVTDRPIAAIGDNALFVREIENALLDGEIDLAVHSMKDLPAECAAGLALAKAWSREDPRDVLVCRGAAKSLDDLPRGARVATGSPRRTALLLRLRPDLDVVDIRGNVDTRLRKLFEPTADEPKLDAIVLAAAGLTRLGRTDVITQFFDPHVMIPAPNQGQLAIELRADSTALKAKVDALGDDDAEAIATAERAFLKETGADCRRPVGAYAEMSEVGFSLIGVNGEDVHDLKFVRRIAGEVSLVGAGPGDPELMTVKGLKAIQRADVIVYDRLVSEELLMVARPDCRRIYVGKASGNHTLPQEEINALLTKEAVQGRYVVRLKGGDPFVFGRGGEEMAYLCRRGIPCSVIPGVTSAIAAAESARIPVTHRGVASGFVVVTAHAKGDEKPSIDFSQMLDVSKTFVFLMGLARVNELAASLIVAGRPAATPAAVVGSASLPNEKCVVGTLADIAQRTADAGVVSPAVLIVGPAVALRRELGLPLSGGRFLVPVIEGGTTRLSERLRALGGQVDEVVVGRIVKIEGALTERDFDGVDRIVLTSKNGWLGLDDHLLAVARERGIRIENVREVRPIGRTLHLTQPDAERVEGVVSIDVYRNDLVPIGGAIKLDAYDAAFFTCASSARRVFAKATGSTLSIAIGRKTAAALREMGVARLAVADEPTLNALVLTAMRSWSGDS